MFFKNIDFISKSAIFHLEKLLTHYVNSIKGKISLTIHLSVFGWWHFWVAFKDYRKMSWVYKATHSCYVLYGFFFSSKQFFSFLIAYLHQITVRCLPCILLKYPLKMAWAQINKIAYIVNADIGIIIFVHQLDCFTDVLIAGLFINFSLISINVPDQLKNNLSRKAMYHLGIWFSIIHQFILKIAD